MQKVFVLLGVVFVLTGCGKQPNQAQAPVPGVSEVQLDWQDIKTQGLQYADRPVAMTLDLVGTTQASSVNARMIELATGLDAASYSSRVKPGQKTERILFSPMENGWAPGRYLVEVKLDNRLVVQRDIDVSPRVQDEEAGKRSR